MFQRMSAEGSAQAKAAGSEISEPGDVNQEKSKSSPVSGDSGVLQTAEVQFVQLLFHFVFKFCFQSLIVLKPAPHHI